MTRQEVKDEMKQTEGSPEVKNRIRKLQQEVSQRKSVTNVAEAQVVIVNPEHFAVALRYDFEEGAAPKVLSKGTDKIAQNIREKAEELGIPVRRLGAPRIPVGYAPVLEAQARVTVDATVQAARQLLKR
jgi:flagellar biosynthetic protein FlhB